MKTAAIVVVMAVALPGAAGAWSEPPVAVSPGSSSGTVVAEACPTFSWGGTEGAQSYELVVYRGQQGQEGDAVPLLVERVPGSAFSWTPALGHCLEPGGSYAWSVRAGGADGESEWSEPLLFEVALGPSEQNLQRALRVVERYLGTRDRSEEEPGSPSAAPEDSGPKRGEPSFEPRALGGADFSIDSSGNVAGLSFTGDGSGLANVTAVNLVGAACVSEAELAFDTATDAELAAHAALSSAHHAATEDTSCTVTDNGDRTATLACDDGSGVTWYLTKALAVSAGWGHTCGLLAGGSVVCWGRDDFGQSTPPSGLFSQISTGWEHTCGVQSNGSVACWEDWNHPRSNPPSGTFSQVSARENHSCGVRPDGSVNCWGSDDYGKSTPDSGTFSHVSAGKDHTCGLLADGSVACWGSDGYGQSSPPSETFAQVSAGDWHTCGVQWDGSVTCWGDDRAGQSTSPDSGTFSQVSAGHMHTCGVQSDGSVACWGWDGDGQSTPPDGTFSQVSAGATHTCGVRPDGSVDCWGDNGSGECNVPRPLQ